MGERLEAVIVLVVITCVLPLLFLFIDWRVHISQVNNFTIVHGRGTYKRFLEEFNKRQWVQRGWTDSWFGLLDDSEIHASIIKFDGRGMTLSYLDWGRVQLWIKNHKTIKSTIKW